MARPRRLVLSGQPLHIVQRGHNGSAVFFRPSDYRIYLGNLAKAARCNECATHAYVLMTNHVHLVVTPETVTAPSRLMQSLGRRYVRYINDRYQRSGTLWQGRFYSCLIESEAYLLACHRYVELNPVRAGMVDHAADYPWSSYHWHGQGVSDPLISDHALYEALGSQPLDRQRTYRQFLGSSAGDAAMAVLREATKRGSAAANSEFKRRIEVIIGRSLEPRPNGRPRGRADSRPAETVAVAI